MSLSEKFYSAKELMSSPGVKLHPKMFDYLRYTLRIIPSPIKYSKGKGLIAVYPGSTLEYLKAVMRERKKGVSFKKIKETLVKEREKIFDECEFIRRQIDLDRSIGSKIGAYLYNESLPRQAVDKRDDDTLEINVFENISAKEVFGAKMEELKSELKHDFDAWDGEDMIQLSKIRKKMDVFETYKAREKLLKAIKQVV